MNPQLRLLKGRLNAGLYRRPVSQQRQHRCIGGMARCVMQIVQCPIEDEADPCVRPITDEGVRLHLQITRQIDRSGGCFASAALV